MWVRSEFLLKSAKIYNAEEKYHQEVHEINPEYSTHIAATRLNTHLPPNYYESNAIGKPVYWIKRYLLGSFSHTEGAVYPDFSDHIVEPFEIPKHWERLSGWDFGIVHPTAFLLAAIDPKTGIVYMYKEHYESHKPVPHHAKAYHEAIGDIPSGLLRQPIGDPDGKKRRQDGSGTISSLFEHYEEYDIYFKAASNRIEDGIVKVFTYFALGRLKIFGNLKNTIREGINYKYKEQKLDDVKNADETPIDKDNHTLDIIRYIIQELPDNPNTLLNKSYSSMDSYGKMSKQETLPFALQDDEPKNNEKAWLTYY
jgi:hypothetical protein